MANDMTLEAVIKLQDEMSKELKKIQKNLDTFENATEDTNRALQDLQKESKQTGKVLQSINFKEGVQTALDFGRAILDAASALGDFVKEYQEFNTLEAQREAGENYVLSQKHQGWKIIPEHYDDGGFSGGNMNRPALEHLVEDINAGKVDMIVVYKIDRLTM